MVYLLLQAIASQPHTTAIATSDSINPFLVAGITAIFMAMFSALGTYLFTRNISKPAEKVEAYEKAEFIALRTDITKLEARNDANLREWSHWREAQSERTAKLEYQMETLSKQISEKLSEMTANQTKNTEMITGIREDIAAVKSEMKRWIK